jgi:hypothetical protein
MNMAKNQKMWIYSPPKPVKPSVPPALKSSIETKANELVDSVLKPKHIPPEPENTQFNYIVDIYTKWYRNYFYFCAKYCCPGSNAITPFFDTKFARLEYIGTQQFNLSYMRHTGQWWEVYTALSVNECFEMIQNEPLFFP